MSLHPLLLKAVRLLVLAAAGITLLGSVVPAYETVRAWKRKWTEAGAPVRPSEDEDASLFNPFLCGRASGEQRRRAMHHCRKDTDCEVIWWLQQRPGGWQGRPEALQLQAAVALSDRREVRLICEGDCTPTVVGSTDGVCVEGQCALISDDALIKTESSGEPSQARTR